MEILEYALLGLLQGLTEFLPVSSKSHLLLAQHWLGLNPRGVVTEISLHVATLLSVLLVYRGELLRIFRERDWAYIGRLALATCVTVALILPLKDRIEALADSPAVIPWTGGLLLVTALWLILADLRIRRSKAAATPRRPLSWLGAALVGLAQGIAILPGISRSGSTIGAGLQLGEDRENAARFSFLLSVPVILGAAVLSLGDFKDALAAGANGGGDLNLAGLAVAFVVALLSGVGAIYLVLWMLRRASLLWFAGYCVLLGCVTLILR
ncbi:undecaprenyl-diphosphate phosphatase [bacterium]|nr:undecaprenyl-diphosphate phosphatase [bacterium]